MTTPDPVGNRCTVKVAGLDVVPREGSKVWCRGDEFDMSSWRDVINLCIAISQSAERIGRETVQQEMRRAMGVK